MSFSIINNIVQRARTAVIRPHLIGWEKPRFQLVKGLRLMSSTSEVPTTAAAEAEKKVGKIGDRYRTQVVACLLAGAAAAAAILTNSLPYDEPVTAPQETEDKRSNNTEKK